MNRVARLIGVAHGGQVVVSEVTAQLTRDRLPPGVHLVDLGHHRLKDLTRPEHVFQLSVNGLEAVFPPLRSLDATATNLPRPRTSFVGRAAELGELQTLVRSSRLVTVTGAGGSGKTRLAVELGRALLGDFEGVWFADLSFIVDGELVVGAVAQAIGLAVSDERPVPRDSSRRSGIDGAWWCSTTVSRFSTRQQMWSRSCWGRARRSG